MSDVDLHGKLDTESGSANYRTDPSSHRVHPRSIDLGGWRTTFLTAVYGLSPTNPEDFGHVRRIVRFGDFEVNLATETLWRNGSRVRIQPQAFQLLVTLLERPGDIISREELYRRLWPAANRGDLGRNLNTALKKVRSVLRDSPTHPRYIETVRGRGYRLLVDIQSVQPDLFVRSPPLVGTWWRRRRRVLFVTVGVWVVAVITLVAIFCGPAAHASWSLVPDAETGSQPGREGEVRLGGRGAGPRRGHAGLSRASCIPHRCPRNRVPEDFAGRRGRLPGFC
jgi:DNA-binding winged helix-turn-helix (wHTH) protein